MIIKISQPLTSNRHFSINYQFETYPSCTLNKPREMEMDINRCKMAIVFLFTITICFCVLPLSIFASSRGITVKAKTTSGAVKEIQLYSGYHALVVGVSDYDSWPDLPYATKDAQGVALALKKMGFTVTTIFNPSSSDLTKALNRLTYKYGREPDRAILFYYAGHGETEKLADGTKLGYIIPKDCPLLRNDPEGFVNKAISMKDIEAYSLRIRSKHVLMLFDSCFSGSLFSLVRAVPEDITEKSTLPVRQYITAGNEDEAVPDRSMFKRCLLLGLEGDADLTRDGYITGTELGLYLSDKVIQNTRRAQHPQYGKIRTPELARGDFIFRLASSGAVVKESSPKAPLKGHLYVNTQPDNARIRILNIGPKFYQGMELNAGSYHVEVSASGYEMRKMWVSLTAGEDKTLNIHLRHITAHEFLTGHPERITNSLGMEFVYIKAGKFMMGSPSNERGRENDEKYHEVTLTKGFYIQATEVTQGHWKAMMGNNPSWFITCGDDCPVEDVSWNDVQVFIRKLNLRENKNRYRLPTEAEWEYAARAGSITAFANGDISETDCGYDPNLDAVGWYCGNSKDKTHPVAKKKANAWGLYDMHGNVWEWCQDWYGDYPSGAVINTKGASSGSYRVSRGGCYSFSYDAKSCRSARRGRSRPGSRLDFVGFRLVRSIDSADKKISSEVSAKEIGRDGNFIAYSNGVIYDKNTGLEWFAGPDRRTDWNEAKAWVENFDVAGGGWRMPTRQELKTLYQKGAGTRSMTPLLKTTGWWVWGEARDSSSAWGISFYWGNEYWYNRDNSNGHFRGFAVRSKK